MDVIYTAVSVLIPKSNEAEFVDRSKLQNISVNKRHRSDKNTFFIGELTDIDIATIHYFMHTQSEPTRPNPT